MSDVIDPRSKAYFVGGGIASLAGAVYLIRDGEFPGKNITIFEEGKVPGGCLDGSGSAGAGYVSRGGRMYEEHYACTLDLFSTIPAPGNPGISVTDDILRFNKEVVSDAECRLLKGGAHVDVSSYGLSLRHQMEILRLLLFTKDQIGIKIEDWFSPSFFETNFWYLWTTSFSFQPWHNADELRRYFLRFIHLLPGFNKFKNIVRTRYNQYDSMIAPAVAWLKDRGVRFEYESKVTDVKFEGSGEARRVRRLLLKKKDARKAVELGSKDLAFITLGSMVESSTRGSMKKVPPKATPASDGAWTLWKSIVAQGGDFGNPEAFCNDTPMTRWVSFTVTQDRPDFFQFMQNMTTNKAGTGGLVTVVDSNWLLSVVLFHEPFYIDQPQKAHVFWGYGLFPERPGNFVKKPMSECNGAEILTEVLSHLRVPKMASVLKFSNCIPTMMPYITAQFVTRSSGDRPPVVPQGAQNFAFLGQFCEIPDDVVFTVEYSVRSAAMAVTRLLGLPDRVPPVYKGQYNPLVLLDAVIAMNR